MLFKSLSVSARLLFRAWEDKDEERPSIIEGLMLKPQKSLLTASYRNMARLRTYMLMSPTIFPFHGLKEVRRALAVEGKIET
jgi:hypothetical protein